MGHAAVDRVARHHRDRFAGVCAVLPDGSGTVRNRCNARPATRGHRAESYHAGDVDAAGRDHRPARRVPCFTRVAECRSCERSCRAGGECHRQCHAVFQHAAAECAGGGARCGQAVHPFRRRRRLAGDGRGQGKPEGIAAGRDRRDVPAAVGTRPPIPVISSPSSVPSWPWNRQSRRGAIGSC